MYILVYNIANFRSIVAENETVEELDLSWNFLRRGSTLKLCEGIWVNILNQRLRHLKICFSYLSTYFFL